jgi:hypothetical protein
VKPDEIIHYASILPNGNMLLNPFHPINIANLITKENLIMPESYADIINNPRNLPYIVAIHKYTNADADIISFSPCF